MKEYIIVGDTEQGKGFLVYACGINKEHAYTVLDNIRVNPTEVDKQITKGMKNLRVEEKEREECWWL